MKALNAVRLAAVASLFAALGCTSAAAQNTDGYHSTQIFPLVVDTASFTQRFNFRNPNAVTVTVFPRYHPDKVFTTQGILTCPSFNIPANGTTTFTSVREICGAIPGGSAFGFLYTSETSPSNLPYAGFSRILNPFGNGFTVEAYPAHTFTNADSVVNGLRRVAATANNPTFQTNCFIGNLNEVAPIGTTPATDVQYTIYDKSSLEIGGGVVNLLPGQTIRLLDVFETGKVPAGNQDDGYVRFEEIGSNVDEAALMTFCTVQDNSTFGADFRIGKQETGAGGLSYPGDLIGSQDNHVARETLVSTDIAQRNFEIGTGASSNTHVVYFRHPDYVQCELIDPANSNRTLAGYGLEMRMLDQDGVIIAGGANVSGWAQLYLGDKTDRNGGSNTRYAIEVESNGQNTASLRPYKLHCQSGSGHTLGDLIRYKEAVNRF